jgi:hypothetical protein
MDERKACDRVAEDNGHDEAPAVSERPVELTDSTKPAPAVEVGPDAPSFWWSGYGPFSFWP